MIGSPGADRSRNRERHGVRPEFFPEHFVYDPVTDGFTCPAGKWLAYQKSKKLVGGYGEAVPGESQRLSGVSTASAGLSPGEQGTEGDADRRG